MIGYLRGNVLIKQGNYLILDVNGVGYELAVPVSVSEKISQGNEAALFVHHSVREDGHYLFGFDSMQQRIWFRELIRVSGIGPKVALLILSGFSGDGLSRIIREQNTAALIKLPGIGKKTAERLLVELNDRVAKLPGISTVQTNITIPASAQSEAEEALIALGYKPAEAAQLIAKIADDTADTDTLIRRALQLKFQGNI